MSKKQTIKRPAPLTYQEIDTLTKAIAIDLAGDQGDETTANMLMVLFNDIANHPKVNAETIANLITSYLFMWTSGEQDAAEALYVQNVRRNLLEGGAR